MPVRLRPTAVAIVAALTLLTAGLALAQEAPEGPQVAACLPGAGYTSGCDVDQDGDIDIFDVQLTAGRWGSSGAYTAGHTHWGETWTGAGVVDGLRLVQTDVSGYRYGVTGTSASTSGRGVYGYVSAASGETFGVQGQSASVAGRGVYGLSTAASGAASGVFGESASTSGRGVYGEATATSGSAYGVYGRSAGDSGRGVFGDAVATSGMNYGVYGRSVSDAGRGVYGDVTATSGNTVGVYGRSASDAGRGLYGLAVSGSGETFGVVGQAESTAGVGVHGYTAASTGATMGVWGLTLSDSGIGVLGSASSTTGVTHGVDGRSYSSQGTGVYGVNYATTGFAYGVYGRSFSTAGYAGYFSGKGNDAVVVENTGSGRGMYVATSDDTAIWAITTGGLAGVDGRSGSSTGRGVYGYATASSGVNYGVYARTSSASGYAGYFLGDLHTTGTLSKAGGSFKIDHPLDPANQYLSHSFVESPDMKNIYDGVALLDARGEATVTLPDWFGALNRDFRYQLTPVGAAMPNLHVAHKIQDNTFRIAGGEPGLEVSWQVTGIRQDAWANAHRIPVEEEKPADERGTYLHPAELGQPETLGLDYRRNAEMGD